MNNERNTSLVIFGPPGAGKGTQGKLLAKTMELTHIASGDLVRKHQAERTSLGLKSEAYYSKGLLVPDEITISMVFPAILATCGGFILDGFPRNVNQAKHLDSALSEKTLQIDRVILIAVPREEMLKRLADRRVCGQCAKVYHLITAPPNAHGKCDFCEGQLYQRDDDKPEAIDTSLEEYHTQTERVADFYRDKSKLIEVDGVGSVEEIFNRVSGVLHCEAFRTELC